MVEQHTKTESAPLFSIKDFTDKYPNQEAIEKLHKEFFHATDIRVLCIANTKYERTRKEIPLMKDIELAVENVNLMRDYLQ